jgi:hypothetical protein
MYYSFYESYDSDEMVILEATDMTYKEKALKWMDDNKKLIGQMKKTLSNAASDIKKKDKTNGLKYIK